MKPPKTIKKIPAMTRAEWEAMPESFKYFHPWDRAKRPLKILKQTTKGGGKDGR
jgi:hypothetical protein